MAKLQTNEQEGKETVEFFKDLDREALNTERFLEKYSKPLGIVFGLYFRSFRILRLQAICSSS
jgi:hypothetical protein